MASRKKQEENHLKILKDLLAQPSNKKCMECDQRGPTYVDVTIGSFVCTSCGGLLRGLNPPHRVKSISMTTFTSQEIGFIESRGNEWCRAVYLGKYDEQSKAKPESRNDHAKLKHFMELKYEQKRWYCSPSQQRKLMESAAAAAKKSRETTTPPATKPLNSLLGNSINNVQIPSAKADISKAINQRKVNKPSTDLLSDLNPPALSSPDSLGGFGSPQKTSSSVSSGLDGFADFDSAFGNFSSAPAPASQPAFAAFGSVSTDPMPFTNSTSSTQASASLNQTQTTKASNVDKYAALVDLDLFSSNTKSESNDFSWSSPAKSVFPSNQVNSAPSQSVFGTQQQAPQNNLFSSAPISNMNTTNPTMSSASWMATPAAPAWSSSSTQWNPSSTTWQPTYQQPVVNPPAPTSNPFFTPATGQQQQPSLFGQPQAPSSSNDFGPFTQPSGQAMTGYGNASGMSSTNPFAAGNAMQQNSGFMGQTMPTMQQPAMNNPSNPFMF